MTDQTPDRDHRPRGHENTNISVEPLPLLAEQEYEDARASERQIRLQMGPEPYKKLEAGVELLMADFWPKMVNLVHELHPQGGMAIAKKYAEEVARYRLSDNVVRTRKAPSAWNQFVREQQQNLSGEDASLGHNTAAVSISYRDLSAEAKAELSARARKSQPGTNSGKTQKTKELKKFRSRVEKDVSCFLLTIRLT